MKKVKIYLSLFLIAIGILMIGISMNQTVDQEMSEHGKILYGFNAKMGKKLGKKYRMSMSGTGGAARQDGISEFALSFERFGKPLNENEARKLIISCVEDFLVVVNADEAVRPFLKIYPFETKNIELNIFNYDNKKNLHQFPNIGVVTISNGKIGYFTEEAFNKHQYKTKKHETFEEALNMLQKESKDSSK